MIKLLDRATVALHNATHGADHMLEAHGDSDQTWNEFLTNIANMHELIHEGAMERYFKTLDADDQIMRMKAAELANAVIIKMRAIVHNRTEETLDTQTIEEVTTKSKRMLEALKNA